MSIYGTWVKSSLEGLIATSIAFYVRMILSHPRQNIYTLIKLSQKSPMTPNSAVAAIRWTNTLVLSESTILDAALLDDLVVLAIELLSVGTDLVSVSPARTSVSPLIGVLLMLRVAPSMITLSLSCAVYGLPLIVITETIDGIRGNVVVPITRAPDGFNGIGVPLMVSPAPPADIEVPAIARTGGLALNVWPSMVNGLPSFVIIEAPVGTRGSVLVPIMRDPEGSSETGVPLIVMPALPADIEVPPIARADGFAVKT